MCECMHPTQVWVIEELSDCFLVCTLCNAPVCVCVEHTDAGREKTTPDLVLNNQHGADHCADRGDGLGREGRGEGRGERGFT